MTLDHTQDLSGTDTYRLTSLYPPPAFVKRASHEQLHGEPERLPAHVYADQAQRVYPCHTAAATWISALFLNDKQAALQPAYVDRVRTRLLAAADFHGIRGSVDGLTEKMAADAVTGLNKLGDADFALVWEAEGAKERHYPLRNAEEVKTAAAWFDKYRDQFAFEDRQQIADKLLIKAEKHGLGLPNAEMLAKTAGYGHCPVEEIVEMLDVRASLALRTHPQEAAELRKLAAQLSDLPVSARDHDLRCKLAVVVDQFDRHTQLAKMCVAGELDRVEDVLFQVTEKTARDFTDAHVLTVTGDLYEKAAFEQLDLQRVRDWMGDDFAEAVGAGGLLLDGEKLAAVLHTLPRGDAELFSRMAAEAGVKPAARSKAASAAGLPREALHELAAGRQEPETVYSTSVLD